MVFSQTLLFVAVAIIPISFHTQHYLYFAIASLFLGTLGSIILYATVKWVQNTQIQPTILINLPFLEQACHRGSHATRTSAACWTPRIWRYPNGELHLQRRPCLHPIIYWRHIHTENSTSSTCRFTRIHWKSGGGFDSFGDRDGEFDHRHCGV